MRASSGSPGLVHSLLEPACGWSLWCQVSVLLSSVEMLAPQGSSDVPRIAASAF